MTVFGEKCILGIDPSIRGTAVSLVGVDNTLLKTQRLSTKQKDGSYHRCCRIILGGIHDFVAGYDVIGVTQERCVMGRQASAGAFGLEMVLPLDIMGTGICDSIVLIAPTTWHKLARGVYKRFEGGDKECSKSLACSLSGRSSWGSHDEAEAYLLARLSLQSWLCYRGLEHTLSDVERDVFFSRKLAKPKKRKRNYEKGLFMNENTFLLAEDIFGGSDD